MRATLAVLASISLLATACSDDSSASEFDTAWGSTSDDQPAESGSASGAASGSTSAGDTDTNEDSTDVPAEDLDVPVDPPVLEATIACIPLLDGETLRSVSPEGHAWLMTQAADGHRLRVIEPGGLAATTHELRLQPLDHLQAWDDDDAVAVAGGGLWRLDQMARIEITTPLESNAMDSACGDPSRYGALLAGGSLLEHRGDDGWWRWDSAATGSAAPQMILSHDGECVGTDDTLWLASPDGTLWRLADGTVETPAQFPGLRGGTATGELLAILDENRLRVLAESEDADIAASWASWRFWGEGPRGLSSANGTLWMDDQHRALAFDGQEWAQVDPEMEEPIEAVFAHSSGIWLVTAENICNAELSLPLRLTGLHPLQRSLATEHEVEVWSDDGQPVSLLLNGEELEASEDPETGRTAVSFSLTSLGWHELVLRAEDGAERTLPFKRAPSVARSWSADIEPLYQDHCTGDVCHGGQDPIVPPMDSLDIWQARADFIRTRVVDAKTMPPPDQQSAGWGDEQIEIVDQWLAGGMLP